MYCSKLESVFEGHVHKHRKFCRKCLTIARKKNSPNQINEKFHFSPQNSYISETRNPDIDFGLFNIPKPVHPKSLCNPMFRFMFLWLIFYTYRSNSRVPWRVERWKQRKKTRAFLFSFLLLFSFLCRRTERDFFGYIPVFRKGFII